jgi:Na+-transporting NADH:ubiquinone oxidoreductase subunit NqrC
MEQINNILSVIVSVVSVVSTVVAAIYFFHAKISDQIQKLQSKVEGFDEALGILDKEMLRYSDPLLQNVLKQFEMRFADIETDVRTIERDHLIQELKTIKEILISHDKVIQKVRLRKTDT